MMKFWCLSWTFAVFALVHNGVQSKSILSGQVPLGIVNGTVADDGEFPYEVQLRNMNYVFICGGSIIGDIWVLTAGHCVNNVHIGSIVYGTNILYQGIDKRNTTISVKRTYLHPKYALNNTSIGQVTIYDVGIVELSEPIHFSDKAKTIKLADVGDVPFHVDGYLAGWGYKSSEEFDPQKNLLKLHLPLLTDAECSKRIAFSAKDNIYNAIHNICSDNYLNGACYLSEPIPFSDKVQPVKLADSDDIPVHVDGYLAGWGYNSTEKYDPQHFLRKLHVPLLTDAECSERIASSAKNNIYNPIHNICSDNYLNGACYGDSGSPFAINGTQYGITSWGVPPCAVSPTCYSRITNPEYREFIRNITGI